MESAHKSGGGSTPGAGAGAGGEGVLCHACGYQYPNGHPSAKQRRAHRKHCGKPTSAAGAGAAAEEGAGEHDGSDLLLGEGGGGAGTDGNGAGATECGGGGGSPGSAHDGPGDAVVEGGGDSAGADPSGNGAGHQVIVIGDKCAEDCFISSSNIPPEFTSEASRIDDGTLTTVAAQYPEKGSPIEDGDPSDPAVGSEHLQDIPTSFVSPEPEDRAKLSSEISEYKIENSSIVPLESDAAGGRTSELTSDVVKQQDGVAVTGEDGMINTIGESKSSERKSVQGDELGLSCQDILQTEIGEGLSSTVVEEDSGDKNPTASNNEEIRSDGTESNQQRKHELTDSFEKVPNIEPVESSAEKFVGTDDDVLQLGKGGCHSEISDDSKAQQQPDSTSGMADHLAISKGADNVEGQHYPTTDESIGAISSTSGLAVDAKFISVDATANLTEDVSSSGITIDDSMQENVTSGTIIPSQADLLNFSPSATAHEINMVDSINDVEEKSQNEKSSTDLASYEVKEMVIKDNFEEKQQNKEAIVDPTPHEANSFPNTENEQNEEIGADTTSYRISAVQNMSSTEEKEQIEEFIANLASEEVNVTSNRNMVEQQDETDVKTNHEIDGACSIEATGENNAAAGESIAGTMTDDVEDKMPNEEITSGTISLNITDSSIEEKMHNEEVNEGLGSRDDTVVHDPVTVKEKMYEETTSGPTLDKFSLLTSTDSPEERKDENTSADPILHETNVAQTSDCVDEEKIGEPGVYPTSSIDTMGSIGDAEDKKPSEETTADPRPVENTTAQGTEDAENSKQIENTTSIGDAEDKKPSEETTADPRPVENTTTQGTENAESSKQNENTTSIGDAEDKKQAEETAADSSIENSTTQGTEDAEDKKQAEETTADPRYIENAKTQGTEDAESGKQNENTTSIGDAEDKKQAGETTADPRSVENATTQGTEDAERSKQNENTTTTDETAEVSQNTNVIKEREMAEDTASKEISTIESTDDLKGATDQNEEIADKEMVTDLDKNHVSLKVLLADKNVETKEKEKKASTKDRVLSFRRRVSKDNVSPVKPGSPKDGSGQQDWNSPARLPVEKKPKGRKQQWVPFICCSSVQ
ncbi:hypothetical protein BDA96_07G209500 [Sorghum bicolor]|uniref:Uncharacterized protein n=2 Tax=Sorghum bicolor TaxID=4558 RepID=A0A1Z5RBJ7_SORBI|nr:uncharacterized protein LOC8063894 [Sorghum bicolor]KAG0524418.1 hypothetical protein BDA96_07G209500 [Sorghum bicolor]OQU80851.1 hypothetical protein SORBI_3007G197100 [Sorghum bicolor]|eukprot:XP_002444718.1 uncharacterized protein LOC8063894 [Sorghum bicolor]